MKKFWEKANSGLLLGNPAVGLVLLLFLVVFVSIVGLTLFKREKS